MDCAAFFAAAEETLESAEDPKETTVGGQCVYEFYHPRVVAALGTDGLATRFNRSGVVWAPPARRFAAEIRVPDTHDDAVAAALGAAPLPFERTDHRGVSGPDGDVVTVLHFTTRQMDVSDDTLAATLSAVAEALAV
jgi:hypothetical protein